jgi:hypothetical protein
MPPLGKEPAVGSGVYLEFVFSNDSDRVFSYRSRAESKATRAVGSSWGRINGDLARRCRYSALRKLLSPIQSSCNLTLQVTVAASREVCLLRMANCNSRLHKFLHPHKGNSSETGYNFATIAGCQLR